MVGKKMRGKERKKNMGLGKKKIVLFVGWVQSVQL
jgi:hypothetical protein